MAETSLKLPVIECATDEWDGVSCQHWINLQSAINAKVNKVDILDDPPMSLENREMLN